MYSRKELGELALRRINVGHSKPEFNVDIREVMVAIDQERDRQVGDYYKRKILAGDRQIEGSVLSDYTIPRSAGVIKKITINSVNFEYYTFKLPFKIISLPYDMGVYEISNEANPTITFDRMPPSLGLYSYTTNETNADYLDSFLDGSKNQKWSLHGNTLHIWEAATQTPSDGFRIRAITSTRVQGKGEVQVPGGTTGTTAAAGYTWAHLGTASIGEYPIPAELVAPVIDAVVARYSYQKPYDSVIDNQDRV
jgi:hypothetical protein